MAIEMHIYTLELIKLNVQEDIYFYLFITHKNTLYKIHRIVTPD